METTPNSEIQKASGDIQKASSSVKQAGAAVGNYVSDRSRKLGSELNRDIKDLNLDDAYDAAKEKAQDIYDTAKDTTADAWDASVSFVKKHPFYTIAGAAAVGFAAAALLRRKH